jgi:hypothetical protein
MPFSRAQVRLGGMVKDLKPGDGWCAAPQVTAQAADSNQTIAASAIAGGLYVRTGLTAGRTDTTATAADLNAALPDMDIGENFLFMISNVTGQTLTVAGGTGVTVVGQSTVLLNTARFFMLVKTGATTFDCRGL